MVKKTKISRLIALVLSLSAAVAVADGGDWKMGPFGPYWDENEWPEFTPMYWMEEFMNRLDDDDDDIREWMYQNLAPAQESTQAPAQAPAQMPGQYPQAGAMPGTYPYYGWNSPSPYGWQPYAWNNPWSNPYSPYALPYGGAPRSGWESPMPGATPPMAKPYPAQRDELPKLTLEEYARMPRPAQQAYRRAFERQYSSRREAVPRSSRREAAPRPSRGALPNLTPEEFSRMPPALQRQYKRDFDREFARYRALQAWRNEQRRGARSLQGKKRPLPVPSDRSRTNRIPGRY